MVSIAELLKDSFKKHNKKTAISFLRGNKIETQMSFADLDLNSNKLANLFLKQGIKMLPLFKIRVYQFEGDFIPGPIKPSRRRILRSFGRRKWYVRIVICRKLMED